MSRGAQLDESIRSLALPPGRAAGDFYDLAVADHRARAQAVQDEPAEHAFRLWLLAFALSTRAHLAVRPDDVDEAIDLLERAIELTAAEDPWRAQYYASLGEAHIDNYGIGHDDDDAVQALAAFRRSVELTSPGHPHRSRRLTQVAVSLRIDGELRQLGGAGFAAALAVHRQAIREAAAGDPRLPGYRFEYAVTLLAYAQEVGDYAALAEGNAILLDVMRLAHPYDSALPHYRQGFAAGRQIARLARRVARR